MITKVYISSTLDLPAYRKAIEDTFRKYGKFFEVVRIAEYMTPGTQSALEECLTDVESCDLYVLIIGFRYGSLAPGKDLSYTHCEYMRAMHECDPKKEIIAFYAADSITELIRETAAPEKFTAFKALVLNTHLGNTSGFSSPDTLVAQLQDALLIRVFENLPPIKNDAITYKCNRTDAVGKYNSHVMDCSENNRQVISCILYGTRNDMPKTFTERIARIEYGMKAKLSIPRAKFIVSTIEVKCIRAILSGIYEMLFPEERNYLMKQARIFMNIAAFLAYLSLKDIQELFLEFVIDRQEMADRVLQETLAQFFAELETSIPQTMLIYISLTVYGDQQFDMVTGDYQAFREKFSGIGDISYLEMVKRNDIYDWIETNLNQQLPTKINRLIDKYFQSGDFNLPMSQVQEKLTDMTNQLSFNIMA